MPKQNSFSVGSTFGPIERGVNGITVEFFLIVVRDSTNSGWTSGTDSVEVCVGKRGSYPQYYEFQWGDDKLGNLRAVEVQPIEKLATLQQNEPLTTDEKADMIDTYTTVHGQY